MRRPFSSSLIALLLLGLFLAVPVSAQTPNNPIGIHILDPSELDQAAKIVNGGGGDWGYVTIPIRANDRSLKKWQAFMNEAAALHLIPLIRLASVPQNSHWEKPGFDEVIDFSNFLSDLDWPTRTKYVIVFNEPNHATEWGGEVSPAEYAQILDFTIDRFKSLDSDFFILPGALDASAPNSKTSMEEYRFLSLMEKSVPGIFSKIDGLNSHSYPNPAFSSRPDAVHKKSIASFRFEAEFIKKFTTKDLPIFITETGWQMESIPESLVASFYQQALTTTWSDKRIVAITPFLLMAGEGEFAKFSLLKKDGSRTSPGEFLAAFPKSAGSPQLENVRVAEPLSPAPVLSNPRENIISKSLGSITNTISSLIHKITGKRRLLIKSKDPKDNRKTETYLSVEIASSAKKRALGLSGRSALSPNQGMLFIFENSGHHAFWMKDMRIPLDFIWISQNSIVEISANIPPPKAGESPRVLTPGQEINWVLEVPAGFTASHNLKIGDIVSLD